MKSKNITFCIPSKNNLRYLKSSITSIKQNSTLDNEIIVWVDQDNDGTEKWLKENKIKYLINSEIEPQGIAAGYNRCIETASNKIVCMFHADMFMGKEFDINIIKHLKPKTVIAGTRIEPPLHPEGKEKIVKDFGMYPEDFKEEEFNNFVSQTQIEQKDEITNGIFAPWVCYKNEIIEIGMHDEEFHSYHEDSDIFNRFILNGMKLTQSRDALVYHLTCRGGQFQDGIEKVTEDKQFHNMKNKAASFYIKKWGSWIQNDEYHHPINLPVYKKGVIINNPNPQLTEALEPWFNDNDFAYQDIIVEVDGNTFTQQDFQIIQQLNVIIKDSGEIGKFELGNLKITINSLNEYQNELIKINEKTPTK